jgi:hypothetical protein
LEGCNQLFAGVQLLSKNVYHMVATAAMADAEMFVVYLLLVGASWIS